MEPVLTAAAAAAVDGAAAPAALAAAMESAGYHVAMHARAMGCEYGSSVAVLAGPGNNGGDGYVAARILRRLGCHVVVYQLSPPRSALAASASERARRAGVPVRAWPTEPQRADLVIDALFGVGLRGQLPAEVMAWTTMGSRVLAVDIASGIDGTTGASPSGAFRAERTVTFHARKVGHLVGPGRRHTGELIVEDVGLAGGEPAFWLVTEEDAPRPPRDADAHKWTAGGVAVTGGSAGMGGAALLAARAALSAGAGAATVIAVEDMIGVYRQAPELLTAVRSEGESGAADVIAAAGRHRALVVGPGLAEDRAFVVGLLAEAAIPIVLDAGGLMSVAPADVAGRSAPTVLTPHAGEFARFAGAEPSFSSARALAELTGAVVVLKGAPTFVAAGDSLVAVTTGGSELATIGTGDVLAGMIAAFIARGLSPDVAARSAAFWHGRAGASLAATGTVTADRLVTEVRQWVW